jgi:thioredoxin reductase (NADPH)
VDLSHRPFRVYTEEQEYLADSLIITTGAAPRRLNVQGEQEFTGLGVSYCATCDGHFFRDKRVIVVGGGDSAIEEGLFLTRYASSVTIVHRRDALRAGVLLQKRAFDHPKMHFLWDTVIANIRGDEFVNAVTLRNVKTEKLSEMPLEGVFIFVGYEPNTAIFRGHLDMDINGYLMVDRFMHTKIPGVFAAGEVCDSVYRQVVTSAGAGAAAAMQAVRFLDEHS